MTRRDEKNGLRLVPAGAALVVWLALLAVVTSPAAAVRAGGWFEWMLDPTFHDWHVIQRGWQAVTMGRDPLADPADPFNYPRLILQGARWGGLAFPVGAQGLLLAAGFLATLAVAIRPRSWREAIFAALLIFSLPVLLMVERGNLDAIAFMLVTAGLLCLARDGGGATWAALGTSALLLAGLLKLYPFIVLVGAALHWRDGRRRWLLGGLLVGLAWCTLHLEEIALILRKTTRGLEPAYGRMLPTTRLQFAGWWTSAWAIRLAGWAGLFVTVATLISGAWWGSRRPRLAIERWDSTARAFALGGSAIYVGTYLLGFNWSYRLVFLFLCLPALWAAAGDPATRRIALAGLGAIAISLLAPLHQELPGFLIVQAAQLGLCGLLSAAVATVLAHGNSPMPDRLRNGGAGLPSRHDNDIGSGRN